jgi:hypothetical protein
MIQLLVSSPGSWDVESGLGTVFSSKDVFNPNPTLACQPKKLLDDKSLTIAHRTLPCFSKVIVCNKRTEKCVQAVTRDRGPYGVTKNTWTSIVDLSVGVQKAIGHNGFEPVFLIAPQKIEKIYPKKAKKRIYKPRIS